MTTSKTALLALAASTLLTTADASAAGIDMNDPRRALGRENDVRVDAQLTQDTVTPGTAIAVTYQIQNFSESTVAVADRLNDASYDEDSRTITIGVGSEVPGDGSLPHLVTIAPGEKKVLRTAVTPVFSASALRASFAASPRYVQVKVTILRDLAPFQPLMQSSSRARLSDALFDRWIEASDTIFLNSLPVAWTPRESSGGADVSAGRHAASGRRAGGY